MMKTTEAESVMVKLSDVLTDRPVRGSAQEMNDLARSMKEVGQLQEIVLDSQWQLIAGRRRLEVAKRLGWTTLRAFVDPGLDDAVRSLKAERGENVCRVQPTREEMLDLAARLMELERPKALARQAAGGGPDPGSGKLPEALKGRTDEKVAAAVGMGARTLTKARAVEDAAKKEPELYHDLGRRVRSEDEAVDPIYDELKKRQEVYAAADEDPAAFLDLANRLKREKDTNAVHGEWRQRAAEVARETTPIRDANGTEIPHPLRRDWTDPYRADGVKAIGELQAGVKALVELFDAKAAEDLWFDPKAFGRAARAATEALGAMAAAIRLPHQICPKCRGSRCQKCKGHGWVPAKA